MSATATPARIRPWQALYLRLWLAVVLAVAVLSLLVGWAWRAATEPPASELVLSDGNGQVVGRGLLRPVKPPDDADTDPAPTADTAPGFGAGQGRHFGGGGGVRLGHGPMVGRGGGPGPHFMVTMNDGSTLMLHLPRPQRGPWSRLPFGFFWTLGLVAVAVALATYPIIRKLTRRLERLQQGVEQWGGGDLSVRVPVQGSDEVAFLAGRFNHAAERIEALLTAQRSLLANASHELRSPLARIRMGLELMGAQPSAQLRDEVTRNIGELDQLIDEILLASRLDAKEADLGTVECLDLVGLAAEECARVDAELELELQAAAGATGSDAGLQVLGVAKLLRRMLRNLLENARRYSQGPVLVQLRGVSGAGVAQVEVRVSDRGPGVPAELRQRIFQPFYRLPGVSERSGGVGLGLALVQSIVQRHGGTVCCEGRDGGGASFVVRLPRAAWQPLPDRQNLRKTT